MATFVVLAQVIPAPFGMCLDHDHLPLGEQKAFCTLAADPHITGLHFPIEVFERSDCTTFTENTSAAWVSLEGEFTDLSYVGAKCHSHLLQGPQALNGYKAAPNLFPTDQRAL